MRFLTKLLKFLIFLFLSYDFILGTRLICQRQHNVAAWITFNQQNNSSFILKCSEEVSNVDKVNHLLSPGSGVSFWLLKII